MIRVLFISRATLFTIRGGDTVQMQQTARALSQYGVAASIELCSNKNIDYRRYQLIHFFNIIRPADILYHIRKSRLPYVVSPIYLEYDDQLYDQPMSLRKVLLSRLGKHGREYCKCLARFLINGERVMSGRYLLQGHKKSIVEILRSCSRLLPNSHSEYLRLKKDFPAAGAYSVIPNAVDSDTFQLDETVVRAANKVLCVARFEPKKNQLNLIKALSDTAYELTLAGSVAPNHKSYYRSCKKAAGANVTFLDAPSQARIVALYKSHCVHVLASWFETTGLSSLEAAACGCNIVITDRGDTVEYFGRNACYCDPASPDSIRKAVDKARTYKVGGAFMESIKRNYNWRRTAFETMKVYRPLIDP